MFDASKILDPEFIAVPCRDIWPLISPLYSADENAWLEQLLPLAKPSNQELSVTTKRAASLIQQVRDHDDGIHKIDALLLEYSLDTKEGVLLMCLAEALLRVPDADTADALIHDKMSAADWKTHLNKSDSLFANASTWGLLLTGTIVTMDEAKDGTPANVINRLVNKVSEPVIRDVMRRVMRIMGKHFVLGRTIKEALKRSRPFRDQGCSYSYDMLGEAALTTKDARKYFDDYAQAIKAVGRDTYTPKGKHKNTRPATISIKLSALHPRYEAAQEERVLDELFTDVKNLVSQARAAGVGINIDAEEADRLELSLKLFEMLYRDPSVRGWGELGFVVQAYSKRALPVLAWIAALAGECGDRIPVRLVKGAYWDAEIKLCQQNGLSGYPVFTRKEGTDTSYLACARFLLSDSVDGKIYPQFATHNAHTVAAVSAMATHKNYEFQRLNGMGDALYEKVMETLSINVCVYAPVGTHEDLLAYLVRRLLENGANSSFVHRLIDADCPISDLTQHPVVTLTQHESFHNPRIPLPRAIFSDRVNSSGLNTDVESQWQPFQQSVKKFEGHTWAAAPILGGKLKKSKDVHTVLAPHDHGYVVGTTAWSESHHIQKALDCASASYPKWNAASLSTRAQCLNTMADLMEEHAAELIALCQHEAGKTIHDCIDEVREAVDFCRYYAVQSRAGAVHRFENFRGETHTLKAHGRGVFVCISPWNFPLAIFIGQIAAALVSGNTVIAKPAEQTSLIATRAVQLFLQAGIPKKVLSLLPGDGAAIGGELLADPRVAGVVFTGSTHTAHAINRVLARRECAPVPFIAETGGQNAMIVDSTALPEQVVRDAVRSAFASAGQRCSALRVLFVQDDIAHRILPLLEGAMKELDVGHPALHKTDVGPVIDRGAQENLLAHIDAMKESAKIITQTHLPPSCESGTFVPPTAIELQSIKELAAEHFGPILHVVRYRADDLDRIIDEINATGFGLTLGIHSRIEGTCNHIASRVRAGNIYVNRDQVGAVVGVQPFGGQGLSGTGPKAGGPRYLLRFSHYLDA